GDEGFRTFDVLGRSHEREGDVIDAVVETELQKRKVAFGDRRDVERAVRVVDADGGAQLAAELDRRIDLRRALRDDEQRDLAVLQVEPLADRDVGRKIAVIRADALRRTGDRLRGN